MFVVVFFILLIGGGFGLAYWKVEAFRKIVKGIGGSGDSTVTAKDIERAKLKLAKEKERTAALQEWANTQKEINTERSKQAAARLIINGGKK